MNNPLSDPATTEILNGVSISTTTPEYDGTDDPYDNNDDDYSHILRRAELSIEKVVDQSAVSASALPATITYSLHACNNGPHTAQNMIITDTLPANVNFVSATPAETIVTGNVVEWHLGQFEITDGDSFDGGTDSDGCVDIDVTAEIQTTAAANDVLTNVAQVSSDTHDPDPSNDQDTATTVIADLANVWVTKDLPETMVSIGDTVTYIITYGNNGNVDAADFLLTDDVLATQNLLSVAQHSDATLTSANGAVTCSFTTGSVPGPTTFTCSTASGTLNAGEYGALEVTVEVGPDTDPTLIQDPLDTTLNPPNGVDNEVRVETSTPESDITDNADEDGAPIVLDQLAGLSGYVFTDYDEDVLLESPDGDAGIENVEIILTGEDIWGNLYGPDPATNPAQYTAFTGLLPTDPLPSNYTIMPSVLTDGDGFYAFPGLFPGTYNVEEIQPIGYASTGSTSGILGYDTSGDPIPNGATTGGDTNTIPGNTDSGTSTDTITGIVLGDGDFSPENNFGEVDGSLEGTIWYDGIIGSEDNTYDGGTSDNPISGVGVEVWEDTDGDGTGDVLVTFTATDANGHYEVDGLPLNKDTDGDGVADSPVTYVVVVNDINNALNGWDAVHNNNPAFAPGDDTADDEDGAGTTLNPTETGHDVTGTVATISETNRHNDALDFAYSGPTGELGNQIFFDADSDGIYDPTNGDTPIPYVTVLIYADSDGDGVIDSTLNGDPSNDLPVATTIADANGNWLVDDLPYGNYIAVVTDDYGMIDQNWTSTTGPNQNNNDGINGGDETTNDHSKPATGFPMEINATDDSDMTGDFGFVGPAGELGNYVFSDDDNDGFADPGERGIDNVELTLYYDINRDGVIDINDVLTDSLGNPVDVTGDGLITTDDILILGTAVTGDDPSTTAVETGWYEFNNLWIDDANPADEVFPYVVVVTDGNNALGGYLNTYDPATNNTLNYDDDATNGGTDDTSNNVGKDPAGYAITLGAHDSGTTDEEENDYTGDFGYVAPASIGDEVFYDTNADGDRDPEDGPIAGVEVTLYASIDGTNYFPINDTTNLPTLFNGVAPSDGSTTNHTTVTDANGEYRFDNLPLEYNDGTTIHTITYQAAVTDSANVLNGYTSTHTGPNGEAGEDTANDPTGYDFVVDYSDGDASNGDESEDLSGDFGYVQLGRVGDQVYYDFNNDGDYDNTGAAGGDAPIENVEITLYATVDGTNYFPINSTSLPPIFSGVAPSDGSASVETTVTDANGEYDFDNLPLQYWDGTQYVAVEYQVVVTNGEPTGYTSSHQGTTTGNDDAQDPAGYDFTIGLSDGDASNGDETEDLTGDFGYSAMGEVGNLVWADSDHDGQFDTGENGIQGVELTLLVSLDGGTTWVDPTTLGITPTTSDGSNDNTDTTDVNGEYSFGDLPMEYFDGTNIVSLTYEVSVTQPPVGYNSTDGETTGTGNNYANDPAGYEFTITPGADEDLTGDFGYWHAGALGDLVFFDADADGTFEGGPYEYGIDGVVVELYDENGVLVGTTVTGDDPSTPAVETGWYEFDWLPLDSGDGDMEYTVVIPSGQTVLAPYTHTTGVTATNDESQDETGYAITLSPAETQNYTGDFGYTGHKAGLSGYSFHDVDEDGVFDPGENPLVGHNIILYGYDDFGNFYGPDPALGGVYADIYNNYVVNLPGFNPSLYEIVPPDVTDTTGYYAFPDLNPGVYGTIEVHAPDVNGLSGYYSTYSNAGQNLPTVQNGEGSIQQSLPGDPFFDEIYHDHIEMIRINAGQISTENNFGNNYGSVGDTVFLDADNNGVQDTGESGIPGVGVTLYYDGDGDGVIDPANPADLHTAEIFTDSNGNYEFTELPIDEDYLVVVTTPPTGYASTDGQPGGQAGDGTANDPAGYLFSLDEDTPQDPSGDFGYTPTNLGEVGNQVFYDANNNGTFDAGDTPIVVELELYDAGGNLVGTTTSDPITGEYYFTNLPFGTYTVVVDDIYGTVATFQSQHGLVPGSTSDNDAKDPAGYTLTITESDPTDYTGDFGYYMDDAPPPSGPGEVGDTVWLDLDGDGTLDAGEPGIPGVTVDLYDSSGNYVGTETTDANGNYLFQNLPVDETYTVVVTDTAGVLSGLSSTDSGDAVGDEHGVSPETAHDPTGTEVEITSGDPVNHSGDFGYAPDTGGGSDPLGFLGNQVWFDVDGDGTYTAGTDTPLQNVMVDVYEDLNGNGVVDPGEPLFTSVPTDANGQYGVVVPYGDYVVQVAPQPALTPYSHVPGANPGNDNNSQNPAGYPITIDASTPVDLTGDFGYEVSDTPPPLGEIGNQIWYDADGDGEFDAGEAPIPGVTVTATDSFGNVYTTTTDTNGEYYFSGLPMGSYTVVVTDTANVLSGMTSTDGAAAGTGNNYAHDPTGTVLTITPSDPTNYTGDFGYELDPSGPNAGDPLGSIGNYVWIDADVDGIQDVGEAPIPGVEVQLWLDTNNDGVGDTLVATDYTDANGEYLFPLLPLNNPGEQYIVMIPSTDPVYSSFVSTHAAGPEAQDPAGYPVVLDGSDAEATDHTQADFGFVVDVNGGAILGSIGNQLFEDTDGDGTYTPGTDVPLSGITVELYDDNGNLVGTAVTDPSGQYLFDNLIVDNGGGDAGYTVVVPSQPGLAGYTHVPGPNPGFNDNSQDPSGYPITLTPTEPSNGTGDFGYEAYEPILGSIGDYVWIDTDGDGIQDPGETPIPGVMIELLADLDNDGVPETVVATTTTDSTGGYLFPNLPLGTYTVQVDPTSPPIFGYIPTTGPEAQDPNGYTVTITPSVPDIDDADFGYLNQRYGNTIVELSGHVWYDNDCDGVAISGDADVSGVSVWIYKDITGNGLTADDPIIAGATTPAGPFTVTNLAPGRYITVVDASTFPTGYAAAPGVQTFVDEVAKPPTGYLVPELTALYPSDPTSDFALQHPSNCNRPPLPEGPVGGGSEDFDRPEEPPAPEPEVDEESEFFPAPEEPQTREPEAEPPLPYSPITMPESSLPAERENDDFERVNIIPRTGEVSDRLMELYGGVNLFNDYTANDAHYGALGMLALQGVMPVDALGNVYADAPIRPADLAKALLITARDHVPVSLYKDLTTSTEYAELDVSQALGLGFEKTLTFSEDHITFGRMLDSVAAAYGFTRAEIAQKGIIPEAMQYANATDIVTRGQAAEVIFRAVAVQDGHLETYPAGMTVSIPSRDVEVKIAVTYLSEASLWLPSLQDNTAGMYIDVRDGKQGVKYVFAHSSQFSFNAEHGTPFEPLVGGMDAGETVTLSGLDGDETYVVMTSEVVTETDVDALKDPVEGSDLVLFTCGYPDVTQRHVIYLEKLD